MGIRTIAAIGAGVIALTLPLHAGQSAAVDGERAPTCLGEEATIVVEGPQHQVVRGTSGRDVIVVLESADPSEVHAGRGDDLLCGYAELNGGLGDDTTSALGINCEYGGRGRDTSQGGEIHNCFKGGRGADVMYGRGGGDSFTGGRGNDRFVGGDGDDEVTVIGRNDVRVDLEKGVATGLGTDRMSSVEDATVGGDGDHVVIGSSADNQIDGRSEGNNRLFGRSGDDQIFGGTEADLIRGGAGDDWLNGVGGPDVVRGGAGDDTLENFYRLTDRMYGGRGADRIHAWKNGVGDWMYGGRGPDRLRGGRGDDRLFGGRGSDRGVGNRGDDLCRKIERKRGCER